MNVQCLRKPRHAFSSRIRGVGILAVGKAGFDGP